MTVRRSPEALLAPVDRELSAIGFSVSALKPLAGGLEFAVFSGCHRGRDVVVKTPWQRQISNDNDACQDARDLLRQEVALLTFARSIGIPTPNVWLLHVCGNIDLIVTTLIQNDESPPNCDQFAAILAALHGAVPPAVPLIAQPGPFATILAERLTRRARVVETLSGVRLALPVFYELKALIEAATGPVSLMHLDLRPGNVLVRRRKIVAVVDWTNAVVGDRALELARLAEYNTAPEGFFAAYRKRSAITTGRTRELIYRLDTAVMLAVVFLSEDPNPERATRAVARVHTLVDLLRDRLAR